MTQKIYVLSLNPIGF